MAATKVQEAIALPGITLHLPIHHVAILWAHDVMREDGALLHDVAIQDATCVDDDACFFVALSVEQLLDGLPIALLVCANGQMRTWQHSLILSKGHVHRTCS